MPPLLRATSVGLPVVEDTKKSCGGTTLPGTGTVVQYELLSVVIAETSLPFDVRNTPLLVASNASFPENTPSSTVSFLSNTKLTSDAKVVAVKAGAVVRSM